MPGWARCLLHARQNSSKRSQRDTLTLLVVNKADMLGRDRFSEVRHRMIDALVEGAPIGGPISSQSAAS